MSSYGHYGSLDQQGQDQLKKLCDDLKVVDTNIYYVINQYTNKVVPSHPDYSFDSVEECERWIMDNGNDPYIIAKHIHCITPVLKTTKELVRSEK